jgi:hypothetical protein
LLYYDSGVGSFLPVKSRGGVPNVPGAPGGVVAVDPAAANLTVTLGAKTAPSLGQLNGTLFALSVPPVPSPTPAPSPRAETPLFVFAERAAPFGPANDVAVLPQTPAATTGLVSSSGLTVSLAPADGLRRDGGGGGADNTFSPQTLARAVRSMFGVGDLIKEAVRMWIEQPAPLQAPADPATLVDLANRPPDMVQQAIPLPAARVAVPAVVDDGTGIVTTRPTVTTEPVVAVAESHPWWLANCEKGSSETSPAAETRPSEEQAAPEQPWEPSTADRVAALLTGLWLGGVALQVSMPERSAEDEPAPPPKDQSNEVDE